MQPIRQGEVILLPVQKISGRKLPYLTLAKGEVTGHSHRISNGQAELYEQDGILYLRVLSKTATLNHEEHHALQIPQGNWLVRIQREYVPQKRKSPASPRESNSELGDNLIHQAEKTKPLSSSQSALPKQRHIELPKRKSETESWDDLMSQLQKLPEPSPQQSATLRQEMKAANNWRYVVD